MGGIIAICGEQAETTDIQAIANVTNYRGKLSYSCSTDVIIAIQQRHNEASIHSTDQYIVAIHGYVRNWEALFLQCAKQYTVSSNHALNLCLLIEATSINAIEDLYGEYSLLVFDKKQRKLLANTSISNTRLLYFTEDKQFSYVASEVRLVQAASNTPTIIDKHSYIETLCFDGQLFNPDDTFIKDIKQIHSTYLYQFARDHKHHQKKSIWSPPPPVICSDEEYQAQALEILVTSIDELLKNIPSAAIALSGGVDSTAIWGLIQSHPSLEQYKSRVQAITRRYPGEKNDETDRVNIIHKHFNSSGSYINAGTHLQSDYILDHVNKIDLGAWMGSTFTSQLTCDTAHSLGTNHLISGMGAEFWLGGPISFSYTYEMMRQGKIFEALKHLKYIGASQSGVGWKMFIRRVYNNILLANPTIKRLIRPPQPPIWLHPELKEFWLARYWHEQSIASQPDTEMGSKRLALTLSNTAMNINEPIGEIASCCYQLPFNDRAAVEFAMSTPSAKLTQGTRLKALLRQSIKNHFPPSLINAKKILHNNTLQKDITLTLLAPKEVSKWKLANERIISCEYPQQQLTQSIKEQQLDSVTRTLLPAEIFLAKKTID